MIAAVVLWARARHVLAIVGAVATTAILILIGVLIRRPSRRNATPDPAGRAEIDRSIEARIEAASERAEEAGAVAAIRIAAARTRDGDTVAALRIAASTPDAAVRRRALIALRRSVEARGKVTP